MEFLILAGGLGTRLRNVISDIAKPMAQVNGKPFLEYLFNWISGFPVTRIIISAGYKADTISNYFGNNYKGIPLDYVIENEPLGTGGAIAYSLKNATDNDVLVLNADTWFPVNIDKFFQFHSRSGAKISIALKEMNEFDRYGAVDIQNEVITGFREKKYCSKGFINGGIYIVNRSYLFSLGLPVKFSFEKEVLAKCAGTGLLKGMPFDNEFIDIGIPEDLYRAGTVMKL